MSAKMDNKFKLTVLLLMSLVFTFFPWFWYDFGIRYEMGFDVFASGYYLFDNSVPVLGKLMGIVCSLSIPFALLCIWVPQKNRKLTVFLKVISTMLFPVCYVWWALVQGRERDTWSFSLETTLEETHWPFYLAVFASFALAVYHIVSWKRRQT